MLRGKRKDPRGISQSTEHYLRAIRELRRQHGYARISDVATHLAVSAPTVANMVHHLEKQKLVQRDQARFLQLTPSGERLAAGVVGRKQVLISFLTELLGIDAQVAEKDACDIEHVISGVTIDRLIDLIKFLKEESMLGRPAGEAFRDWRRQCSTGDPCDDCEFECEYVMSACDRIMNLPHGEGV